MQKRTRRPRVQFQGYCNQNARIQYSLSPIRVRIPVETKAQNSVYQTKDTTSNTAESRCKYRCRRLFDFDGSSGIDELFLDRLSLFLVDAFLNGLGRAIYQVLGFLQPQTGDFPHGLDYVDLVCSHTGE